MRKLSLSIALLLLMFPSYGHSKALVADIASQRIEIHSGFTGIKLPMYGARNESGDVLIVVRGPAKDFTVRKKQRIAGMWVNAASETFEGVPSYYALASSRKLDDIQDIGHMEPLKLGPEHILHSQNNKKSAGPFAEALKDHLELNELLVNESGEIIFLDETLFKKTFTFPDSVPRGLYTAEVYLISDGEVVGVHSTPVEVAKIGLDAFMYDAAIHYSLFYGLAAIFLAIGAGWLANQLFERM